MALQVLSVSQLNEYIRAKLDSDPYLSNVAVKGELSNYKIYPSGHHYFTLKDGQGALKCVMFRSSAGKLRFKPQDGMQVIAMGKITVYPRDGAYQLYCSAMAMDGIGDLYAAFEQLKAKLSAKGMFDPAYKKPIPKYPRRIGIVTSSAGAAVHDMLRILRARYPIAKVLLLPVRVQGTEAPPEISAAIGFANHHDLCDVLIVGRGGGSIEDLWAFNDERVAEAIFRSRIPVISAVGHEPDITISDYVADLRAATPSNAAELVVPDQTGIQQTLDSFSNGMRQTVLKQINDAVRRLKLLASANVLTRPEGYLISRSNQLQLMKGRLVAAQNRQLGNYKDRFLTLTAKLDAMSPLKVLTRGYSITQSEDGTAVRSVKEIEKGQAVHILVQDGRIDATVINTMENEL